MPPPGTSADKKRKADSTEPTDPSPSREVFRRECKRRIVVSKPVLACGVVALLTGRNDEARLTAHLKAIASHKAKYQARVDDARRKNEDGDASDMHAVPANKAKVTEAIGEHETTVHILQHHQPYELLWGFSAGTGIDQVWAKVMPDPTSYLIVEAKGPGASLSTSAAKGDQMSKMWVRSSLEQIINSRSSSAADIAHAQSMLDAMDEGPPPDVRGLVVEAIKGGGAREVACPDKGVYHATA